MSDLVTLVRKEGDELRYERKYVLPASKAAHLFMLLKLHSCGFREVYPRRRINNIYFDTHNRDCVNANRDGRFLRVKVRQRWYNAALNDSNSAALEFKYRVGNLIGKTSFPCTASASFTLEAGFRRALEDIPIPLALHGHLMTMQAMLFNCYDRRYFLSACGAYRITVDECMTFQPATRLTTRYVGPRYPNDQAVMEIKYGVEAADGISRIVEGFPFRSRRYSKYVDGVELLGREFR